jgi:PKD repeat protein
MNSVDPKDQPLKISLKRFLLILGTALFCLLMPLNGLLLGAQHEVQVEFSFDVNALPNKQIAGYRLYMEGQEVCNTGPVDPQNITCMVTAEDGTYDFTLATRYDDDSLSPQSAAFPFTITTEAPPPPVITLAGATPQIVEQGSAYIELGATATDVTPGDLTGALVIDASAVETTTVGSYLVTYNVTDGAGNPAVQVTRTVMVVIDELSHVTILDAWAVDGSYATQDAIFNVSAGTDRIVLVGLSAEKNGNGPIAVTSVSLGDQELTEVFDFTVGSSGAYHNLHWLGYLLESEIAARSGSELTVTYANQPSNPFDEPKIHYASYEHVDQTTPIGDSDSNFSTNASSLQLINALTAGDGDKIVGLNVLGQHYVPGLSTSGHTEETDSIGANNGHTSAAYHRTATTSVTENPTFTSATATRMAVSAVVLKAAGDVGTTPVPVIANAAADPTSGEAPFSVILNGNGSRGPITGYSWIFGDGNIANGISTTHLYQAVGTYTATLTVTAADGTTDNDTVVITVNEPPPPPVASISPQSAAGVAPFTIQFDGNNCTGTINSYSWSFGDGVGGSGQSASHTYQTPGTYTATLTVAGAGTTSTDDVAIEVTAPPVAPTASITCFNCAGDAPITVQFDGSGSTSPQPPIESYHWDLGGGVSANEAVESHTFTNPGTYNIKLTVTDSLGLTGTKTIPVVVSSPPEEENQPPVSSFTFSTLSGEDPLALTFDGSGASDPDGTIEAYNWDFGDGSSATGVTVEHSYTEAADYTVTLQVRDDGGETGSASTLITVLAEDESLFLYELGELEISHEWLSVTFNQPFEEPIIVFGPPPSNDPDPITVRVRNVTREGFEVRLQEWDYQDGTHLPEIVNFFVVEQGVYDLPDGTKVEAGMFTGTNSFQTFLLEQPQDGVPVILTQVTSENKPNAVTGRVRRTGSASFQYKLQEQESTKNKHAPETVHYIAWQPGSGLLPGDLYYETAITSDSIKHNWVELHFETDFAEPPLFLADMQSQDGGDTSTIRTQSITNGSVQIKIEEEQSRDSETNHTSETAGYIVFGFPSN